MSLEILRNKPPRDANVQAWLEQEIAEQLEKYQKISYEMNFVIADKREEWIRAFEQRLQMTGFNWHADNKKIIRPEQIYPKPDREFKVVF